MQLGENKVITHNSLEDEANFKSIIKSFDDTFKKVISITQWPDP